MMELDQIKIEGLEIFANHGVFPEENVLGQKFIVSATLYTDTRKAGKTDELTASIHYGEVSAFITEFVKSHTYKLLERVAEELVEDMLQKFDGLEKVTLEIQKPWAPVGLPLKTVSVRITRSWHTAYIALGSNMGDSIEGHELTIIDIKEEKVSMVGNALDVMAIQGNATSSRVQEEAGVEEADLLIAVTNKDEVNLLCCLIARKAGHCQTIARVRDPGYYAEIGFIKEELGLSMAINPELAAASDIARLIRVPSAMEVDSFAKGKVELVRFRIPEGSPWANKPISEAGKKMGKDLLICILEREGSHEVLIPDGNVILHEGDYISVIVSPSKMKAMFSGIGIESRMIRDVVIAGGGTLAYYLAKQLLESRIQVKIIENNRARCDELSELLPKAMIIYGDASGTDLLKEEGIENADA